jgi:hypothetical protein
MGLTMPRYYIDVRSRFGVDEDLNGIELPDITAAYAEVLKVAGNLLDGWSGVLPEARKDIMFDVLDESLRIVSSYSYFEVEKHVIAGRQDSW